MRKQPVLRRDFFLGIISCGLISTIFLWSLVVNLTKPLGLAHNDVYQNMFIIKHVMDTVRNGAWSSLPTLPMLYGFSDSYLYNEPFILHAIAGLPIYLITGSIVITYNLLALFTVAASLIAVWLFAYNLTGKWLPSVIAAVVAVLNPFVMTRFPDHLNLVTLVFLPLIFLFVERILARPTPRNCLVFFLLLSAQAVTSFYYAAFLTLILPIYAAVRFWQEKTDLRKLLQWGTIVGFLIFVVVVGGMVKIYSRTFLFGESSPELDRRQLLYFSAWPTDWLFAPEQNMLYGAIRPWVVKNYPGLVHHGTPSEQNLFPGVAAIVLWTLSFFVLRKTAYQKHFRLFVVLGIGSLILSFGPVIHITSSVLFPGVFDIVSMLDPVLRTTRVTARFGVFMFLFGGAIAAMAVSVLSSGKRRITGMIPVLILFLILAEYWNRPFQFLTVSPARMAFYSKLNQQKHIRVVLDVPVGDAMLGTGGSVRQEYLDAHYMLWASVAHNKTILGGYEGFLPWEYYVRMHTIASDFPSPDTVSLVRKWGADAVILHRDEYVHPTDYRLAKVKLAAMGVPLVEEADGLALFDLTQLSVQMFRGAQEDF